MAVGTSEQNKTVKAAASKVASHHLTITFTGRDIPLYETLEKQAAKDRRSISTYTLMVLEAALKLSDAIEKEKFSLQQQALQGAQLKAS